MLLLIRSFIITVALLAAHTAVADKFIAGPVIKNHGKHAKVKQQFDFDKNALFKIAFDISEQGEIGKINRQIETLARFINMHVANGVPAKNIHLALVVHGKAGFDLLKAPVYQEKFQQQNANNALLQALMNNQVEVLLCGQSAAYFDIANDMLMPGVKMALSAMTAHAVLQSNGYSVNPF
jgi:intracellular sulfur oxidation DsrE/DsrF family protein